MGVGETSAVVWLLSSLLWCATPPSDRLPADLASNRLDQQSAEPSRVPALSADLKPL